MKQMCAAVSLFVAGACVAQSAVIGTITASGLGVLSVLPAVSDPWIRISLYESAKPALQCHQGVVVLQCVLAAR